MTKLEKVIYTAKAHTTGGRDGGTSRTDDGRRQVALSLPGTPGTGTNPEQLFAAGWSACFIGAIKLIAGKEKEDPTPQLDLSIDAEVDLGLIEGVHHLAARLNVNLPGMDQEAARSLVESASHTCPYSLATSLATSTSSTNVITSQAADHALPTNTPDNCAPVYFTARRFLLAPRGQTLSLQIGLWMARVPVRLNARLFWPHCGPDHE